MARTTRLTLVALAALGLTGLIPISPGMTVASPRGADAVDVVECYNLRNGGACVNCCKDLGFPGNACARFCNGTPPPPPPEEPQP